MRHMFEPPYFIKFSQQKAERLSTIIEEFYLNNAQRSFNLNISKFIRNLSPYTLEAILTKDINNPSFRSKLEYSIGLQNIYFDRFDPHYYNSYNIMKIDDITPQLQEWMPDNGQPVLTYQQKLYSDSKKIGTVFLVFSEATMSTDELIEIRHYSGPDKKNIHFLYLVSIPVLMLLLLFLIYREIRKRGHLRLFSPQINIIILTIFFGIALIVFFCINPQHSVQYQDERWYAEKLLEKAKHLKNLGKDKLSKDYFKDIEKMHLPDKKQNEIF
jgi:hypothetical protein